MALSDIITHARHFNTPRELQNSIALPLSPINAQPTHTTTEIAAESHDAGMFLSFLYVRIYVRVCLHVRVRIDMNS